jgi:hypothetical protein
MDGSGLRGADTVGAREAAGPKGTTALDRFSQDLTEKAASGEMDPNLSQQQQRNKKNKKNKRPEKKKNKYRGRKYIKETRRKKERQK